MLGEEERSEEEGSFSKSSIPKRIAIVLAGGLVNIVFGLIVYFILATSTGNYISNEIDMTQEYSSEIGIENGDKIIAIDGEKIRLKSDYDNILKDCNGRELLVTIKRQDKIMNLKIIPKEQTIKQIGIYLGNNNEDVSAEIKSIYKGTPAESVGLKENDIIISIEGEKVDNNAFKIIELISNSTKDTIEVIVLRDNREVVFNVGTEEIKSYYLGVTFKIAENNFANNLYYGFWDTIDFSVSIIDNLKLLFTGNISTDQLMGPVGISEVVSKTKGLTEFIYMLALISLSLGVTNLLPFPPLDGGKIVILLIEAIRRKPIKENIEIGIQMAGFMILIGLSIYITYNDILRIF